LATFRQFFTPSHIRSVGSLLQRIERPAGHDERERVLRGRLDHVASLLTLMDRLTANLVQDASRIPKSLDHARRVARDFEALLRVVEYQGIRALLRDLRPEPSYPQAREEFLAEYDQCLRSYREFSKESQVELRDSVFNGDP
jgi:hypothetical protein